MSKESKLVGNKADDVLLFAMSGAGPCRELPYPVDREDGILARGLKETGCHLVLPHNLQKDIQDSNHVIPTSVINSTRKLPTFKDFTKETSDYV